MLLNPIASLTISINGNFRQGSSLEWSRLIKFPEWYDKRPDWPPAEAGNSLWLTNPSQCLSYTPNASGDSHSPLHSSSAILRLQGLGVSALHGLVETMKGNQSWEENQVTLLLLDYSVGFWKPLITTTPTQASRFPQHSHGCPESITVLLLSVPSVHPPKTTQNL